MNGILSPLLERLLLVEKEMDRLDGAFSDQIETLNGQDFPEQETLVAALENTCLAVTHEMASEIGFAREKIARLEKFIRFRRQYKAFSENDLALLIDAPTLPPEMKTRLLSLFDDPHVLLETIDRIRHEWNATFKNRSYEKIRAGF